MNATTAVPAVVTRADTSGMGGSVQAIVPQTFDQAWRFAQLISASGMAPKGFDKPETCMVAILHGLELGLTPMAALQSIAVVNGRPTIYGDGLMALVRGSGLCEWIKETVTGEGEAMVATCQAKRRGDPEPALGTFSVADAKKAGLWGKQGPWVQYPKRMLVARARAFVLRDAFADVLRGFGVKEEMEDVVRARSSEYRDVTPRADFEPAKTALTPPRPPSPPKPPSAPKPVEAEVVEQQADELSWPTELESYSNRLGECETEDTLVEAIESFGGVFDDAPADVQAEARKLEAAQRASIERQA